MAYQYKREPLSDDEINRLTNGCVIFQGRLVIFPPLNHQWQSLSNPQGEYYEP
jgi:hypothetical protein